MRSAPMLIHLDDDLQDLLKQTWTVRRKVVAVGGEMTTAGWELAFHSHEKAQLLLSISGVVTCEAAGEIWIVPPQSAIFIPSGIMHRLAISGKVQCYVTLIEAKTAARDQPGSSLVIAKSADLLFVQALRSPLRQETHDSDGWIRGVADPYVGSAFAAMHAAPERPWMLQDLAKKAGCSRAIFAKRALSYLTEWRMHLAAGLLLQGDTNVATIATRVGYRPDAFANAFKRWSGISPRDYRSRVAG